MRFRHLLLEYDRSRTVERYGIALADRMHRDVSCGRMQRKAFNDGAKSAGDMSTEYTRSLADQGMEAIEKADPTPNKEYVPWLLTRYLKGDIKRFEDITSTAADCLEVYHMAKRVGFFKKWAEKEGNPEYAKFTDIGQIRSLMELRAICNSYTVSGITSNSQAEKSLQDEMAKKGEVKILFDDETWKIVELHSKRAAMFYGRNTQWCTAAKNDNMFDDYHRTGRLYVVLNKPNNRRWQFHFEEHQLMDENDEDALKDPNFPHEIWGLISWTQRVHDGPLENDAFTISMLLGASEASIRAFDDEGAFLRDHYTVAWLMADADRRKFLEKIFQWDYPDQPRVKAEGKGWSIEFFQSGTGVEGALSYLLANGQVGSGVWKLPEVERAASNSIDVEQAYIDLTVRSKQIHILTTDKRTYYIETNRKDIHNTWVSYDGAPAAINWNTFPGFYNIGEGPGFLRDCPDAWKKLADLIVKT